MSSITAIILAALVVGVVGIIVGFLLVTAGEKFKVEVDEKEVAIRAELPGNNCGGCGFPGCDGLAAAIAKGEAPANQCPVGGAPVAAKISAILGVEVSAAEKQVAVILHRKNATISESKTDVQQQWFREEEQRNVPTDVWGLVPVYQPVSLMRSM